MHGFFNSGLKVVRVGRSIISILWTTGVQVNRFTNYREIRTDKSYYTGGERAIKSHNLYRAD